LPSSISAAPVRDLIYAGNQARVFRRPFLTDVAQQTNLRGIKILPRASDAEAVRPPVLRHVRQQLTLAEKERKQLRKYLTQGGFLLVSPGCSDEKWDKAFRQELKVCFPEYALKPISMSHPIFSLVNQIPRLTDKHGKGAVLEGLEINGRLVMVYSKEGERRRKRQGCCCCGGNELRDPARVNVNVFTARCCIKL
jgi:hypothetical protein